MLLYICGKSGVRKNKVVYTIELGCTLLSPDSNLIITAPISAATDNIGDSIIHTSLAISIRNKYKKSNKISNLCIAQYIMIVDKINMVELEILSNIGKKLAKVCGFSNSCTTVFGGLPIVIVIGDFYQFPPIAGCFL